MKQFLRHIFLLLALFVATANVWAECYLYENKSITIEYDDNERLNPSVQFPENNMPAVQAHFITPSDELSVAEAEAIYFADYVEKVNKAVLVYKKLYFNAENKEMK